MASFILEYWSFLLRNWLLVRLPLHVVTKEMGRIGTRKVKSQLTALISLSNQNNENLIL